MSLHIDATNTDDVIRAIRSGNANLTATSISLGASVELALWNLCSGDAPHDICSLAKDSTLLSDSLDIIKCATTPSVQPFEERNYEFFALDGNTNLSGLLWGQFLSRFAAAIRRSGLPQIAQGLSGVFHDLADNIGQHSRIGEPSRLIKGIAGYSVEERSISFAIGDDGVGALTSLKTSRQWAHLNSDREAVLAVACDHASRREGQGDGQGYKNLFALLARFNGRIRLHSGTGIFLLTGALDKLTPIGAVGPRIPGLQLSIECNF